VGDSGPTSVVRMWQLPPGAMLGSTDCQTRRGSPITADSSRCACVQVAPRLVERSAGYGLSVRASPDPALKIRIRLVRRLVGSWSQSGRLRSPYSTCSNSSCASSSLRENKCALALGTPKRTCQPS
jgi:hypothetical protein